MDAPTADDVRLWAPPEFDWTAAGYAPPAAPGDPDRLQKRVEWSVGEILNITGRTLEDITSIEDTAVAEKAIVLKTMLDAMGGTQKALKVLESPWLRSFTAGSYSETRFSAAEMSGTQGRGSERIASLGPEPLATLLILLMNPEKRAEWMRLLGGATPPASRFVGVDWGEEGSVGPAIFGPGIETDWPFRW